ncbi:LysR substrate-binding domain-containing protein [Pannonibacter carbonis]|uniref:LysR substrate-binding domain-containing protein n=1 Tax=Pannonibacter carbonis TaxID=2067569 RepID=UPI000D0E942E|nr:LysR substrate-binding domain-containing protein [Pannonibacter carbonis]
MGLVNVDVDLLRTLLVVADLRNFTSAGEKLHRTQSAISLQIKRLEQIVGERIFDRGSGKDIRLTKTGELVRSYAAEILRLNDALVQEIQSGSQPTVMRIGMPDDYADVLLPKVIAELARRNEKIEMQIITDLSTRLGSLVDTGHLDLAFMTRDAGIAGLSLLEERLSWVCAPQARLAADNPLPLALFPEGCGVRRNALDALDAVGKRWHIAYCSANFSTLKTAILAEQAIGVLPTRAIPDTMIPLGPDDGLPELRNSELLVQVSSQATPTVLRLASHLLRAFEVELTTGEIAHVPMPRPGQAAPNRH